LVGDAVSHGEESSPSNFAGTTLIAWRGGGVTNVVAVVCAFSFDAHPLCTNRPKRMAQTKKPAFRGLNITDEHTNLSVIVRSARSSVSFPGLVNQVILTRNLDNCGRQMSESASKYQS